MLPCPSPPALCRAATGAGDTAAEWPWCGDSSLSAHGDLCGQRPAEESPSLLTALEVGRSGSAEASCLLESLRWGGVPVLLLARTDVVTPTLSTACHPLPQDRVPGSCQLPLENKLFPGVLTASSCLRLPASACAVGWGQCLWHRQAVQQGQQHCQGHSGVNCGVGPSRGVTLGLPAPILQAFSMSFPGFSVGFPVSSLHAMGNSGIEAPLCGCW